MQALMIKLLNGDLSPMSKNGKTMNQNMSFLTRESCEYVKPPTPKTYRKFSMSIKDDLKNRGFQKII